jgi:predicted MFS family arabinose efflux permease
MAAQIQIPTHGLNTTFTSLKNPHFRLYLAAQIGSNIGAWIQITAENWLVLQLTDSGLSLGVTNALQFGPLVFFGLYGGVIADRLDRRRLLIVTQSALALLATAIGLLVAAHLIQLWMIWLAALLLGLIIAVDKPALLTFVKDLVGEADLANAVALNNAVISSGRMIGPAVSGFVIASFGMAPSFFVNAVSFGLVVLVLMILDVARLHVTRPVERKPGQVREGLSYIRQDRVLTLTVIAMSAVFVAAYNFQVLVPLLTSRMLGGSSELYGMVMSSLGLGAVAGSLLIASWVKPGAMMVALWCGLLSIVHLWLALPFGVHFVFAEVFLLGVASGLFNVTVASTLQLRARDDVRGRVMVMYSIGILGSGLIGAPLAGTLADMVGVSDTFLIIAAICGGTAAAIALTWSKYEKLQKLMESPGQYAIDDH